MANEKQEKLDVTRRNALKIIATGVGVGFSLPVIGANVLGQQHTNHAKQTKKAAVKAAEWQPKFFSAHQNATISIMSEQIIPADDHSPGAKEAKVNEFIDLIISEAPKETQQEWVNGLEAIDKMSNAKYGKNYLDAATEQQIDLLKEISRNEKAPKTIEEKFFKTIKNATIDGYYTSEIGIHKELRYKGNTYLKEFKGCEHPEHQA